MTRQVVIGAAIGFALTVIGLSVLTRAPAEAARPDAGTPPAPRAEVLRPPQLQKVEQNPQRFILVADDDGGS